MRARVRHFKARPYRVAIRHGAALHIQLRERASALASDPQTILGERSLDAAAAEPGQDGRAGHVGDAAEARQVILDSIEMYKTAK